jgi:hypothetical protein
MDNKEKQKRQRTRVPAKEEPGIQWELSEDDKEFLKSCNIKIE